MSKTAQFCAGDFLLDDGPQSGRSVETDSDQIETMRKLNVIPHGRQPTYSKYPDQ